MKLGLVTPGLTLLPRAHAHWEATANFADIIAIGLEAGNTVPTVPVFPQCAASTVACQSSGGPL